MGTHNSSTVNRIAKESSKQLQLQSQPQELLLSSSTASSANLHTQSKANDATLTRNQSLRAILSICLLERPRIVVGALIRDCLLGRVYLGSLSASTGAAALPFSASLSECMVIKEFNLPLVFDKQNKQGLPLHEDAVVELRIHAYISKQHLRNVIQLHGVYLDIKSKKLCAYMEYAAKGELFSLLRNRNPASPLPASVAANFFVQILQGIRDLHAINIVHRDLSLGNVLLTAHNEVKICDFGLATICAPGVTISDGKVIGKVNYMCPELFYGERYDPRLVDIWSAGVLLFIMLTSVFPYNTPKVESKSVVMLCHGKINDLLKDWNRPLLEQDIIDVFAKIFCSPGQRWQAHQLLQLPFCQRYAHLSNHAINLALKRDSSSSSSSTILQTAASASASTSVPIVHPISVHDAQIDVATSYSPADSVCAVSPASSTCSSTASTRPSSAISESTRMISECSLEVEMINSLNVSASSSRENENGNPSNRAKRSSSYNALSMDYAIPVGNENQHHRVNAPQSLHKQHKSNSPSAFRSIQKRL